jgi:NADP-dependent 3-hydroxy acid dehydrogenase YdfG
MNATTSAPTVVVTGASAGTGRAIVREFAAAQGARIALLARGRTGLEAAAADVKHAGGQALPTPVDVANFDEGRYRQPRPGGGAGDSP